MKPNKLTKPKLLPIEYFLKNPAKTTFKLSPDGKLILYRAPYKRILNIYFKPINSNKTKRITNVNTKNIMNFFWGNNEKILYLMDNYGDENFHLFSVDINTGVLKDLTPFDNVKVEIIDELKGIDSRVLIGMNKRNPEIFDSYVVDIKIGDVKLAAVNPGNITTWVADHEGKIRAALTTDGLNSSLLYRDKETDEFEKIFTFDFKDSFIPLFFSFDDKNLYASSNLGRDKNAIVLFDIKRRKEKIIFEHPEYDVYRLKYSQKRKVITYAIFTSWKQEVHFLDKKMLNLFKKLKIKFGNRTIVLADNDIEENIFIVYTISDRHPGSYYLYNFKTNKLNKILDCKPWLKEKYLSKMKPVTFFSHDGLKLNGYLTLPLNKKPKMLPAILLVHGGPWVRDEWGYNIEAQLFANRGYAVLQINYRGSTGYGRKFWQASFKQWGRAMQNDLTDGVTWLIEKGIANPKKIAIRGSSYGGYAVLSGLTMTPYLYACGVDSYGISNIFTFIKSIPPYWKPYIQTVYEMIGHPVKDRKLLREISPIFHVNKIKAPLLISQGKRDVRVNFKESEKMVDNLKKRGSQVEFIVHENEGHGYWNEKNVLKSYRSYLKFLSKYLGWN